MRKSHPLLLLPIALLAAVLAYLPGLHGPFIFDDGLNIVSNQHLRLDDFSMGSLYEAAFSIPNGFFRRPVSMLSFAVNFYFDRHEIAPTPSTFSFKAVNLAIHLFNGIAIYILTWLLTTFYRERRQPSLPHLYPAWLALAVSAAWLVHPLNLTSVLYVVQRMTSLAALFTFIGLSLYVWGRVRLYHGLERGRVAILAGLLAFTPLAFLSKENGLLLPFFMSAVEAILFRFETTQPEDRQFLIIFFSIFVLLPVLVIVTYLIQHPDWLIAGYTKREFTITERLMTEARIIWFYLRLIVLPSTALMGIYHDDIAVSRQLFDPATTLPAILGVLALSASVWLLRKRLPLVAFGILFFLVGHSLESTFLPLEIAHEHRNYLPMFGILLVFFHLLLAPFSTASMQLLRRVAAFLVVALFTTVTYSRANDWSNSYSLWNTEVEHHPDSVRTNTEMGDFHANALTFDPAERMANYQRARHYYEQAIAQKKQKTLGLFGLIQLSALHDQPVEMVWLKDLIHSLEHDPIPSNTNDLLMKLANCRIQQACPLTPVEIDQIMHAALRNPNVTGRDKALMYSALTFYLFRIKYDYAAAAASARRAVALDPQDLDHQLWLATILITMRRFDDARKQIALLKQLDTRNMRAKDIAFMEKHLAQDS